MRPSRASCVTGTLVGSVAVLGMLNSFTSRIRAQAFGPSNYVVTIYNSFLQTFIYLAAYGLLTSYGIVPRGQLSSLFHSTSTRTGASSTAGTGSCVRWHQLGLAKYLLLAGASDVADNVTGFTAEPHLSTLMYALMNQATVPFTVAITLLCGVRYSACELLSVLVVVCAAVACVLVQQMQHAPSTHDDSAGWAAFAAVTTSFAAVSYLLKEKTFRDYRAFVTMGVVINGISLLTCVPIVAINRLYANDVGHDHMPPMGEALRCLWTCGHDAALWFGVYACVNLLWNAALLLLTQHASALLTFLALKMQVPLVALLSTLPWPVIGSHPASPLQWATLSAMAVGITSYQCAKLRAQRRACTPAHGDSGDGGEPRPGRGRDHAGAASYDDQADAVDTFTPPSYLDATRPSYVAPAAGTSTTNGTGARPAGTNNNASPSLKSPAGQSVPTGLGQQSAAPPQVPVCRTCRIPADPTEVVEIDATPSTLDTLLDGLPSAHYPLTFGAGTHAVTSKTPPPPPTPVRIYDARTRAQCFDLQRHSFELVGVPAYECDMYDGESVIATFYPAMERMLLAKLPGATRVLLFDHLLRNKPRLKREIDEETKQAALESTHGFGKGAAGGGGAAAAHNNQGTTPRAASDVQPRTRFLEAPLSVVHGDYTARSGYSRARQLLAPYCADAEIDRALSQRFALVNVWHHFGPQPVQADPMAFAVWGSFSPRDVRTKRLTFPHRIGETYQGLYSPGQQWVHFRGVTRDEAILIKTFDSLDDGGRTSRFSIHSAFRYPEQDTPCGAALPVRESIELRALVLYGDGLETLAPAFSNVSLPSADSPQKVHEQAKLTELEIYNLVRSEILPASDEW